MYLRTLLLVVGLTLCLKGQGQDLEHLEKIQPIQLSGSIGASLGGYTSFGIPNRSDRLQYLLNGNLNIRLFEVINIPVGVTISQQATQFLQPYNQFGISPHYKWIKAHLGYRRMTFSQLTLNGHTFLGAGVELTPPRKTDGPQLQISAMYGRLRRAVDTTAQARKITQADRQASLTPAYRRMGFGLKVGLLGQKRAEDELAVILFRGWDDANSISLRNDSLGLKPVDNLALGLVASHLLFNKVLVKADFGASAFTRDSRSTEVLGQASFFDIGGLYTPRTSTQYKFGLRSSADYRFQIGSIGLTYNYIETDYQTLGSYYFLNDIEEATLRTQWRLFKGTGSIAGSIGGQRNNLDQEKQTRSTRFVGSLNYNQAFGRRVSLSASMSNYSNFLRVERDLLISDSLNFYQVSQNYNAGLSIDLTADSSNVSQALSLNGGYQVANSRDEYNVSETETDFYNANAGYRIQFPVSQFGIFTGLNYNRSGSQLSVNTNWGPTVSFNKSLFKRKVRLSYNLTYLRTLQQQVFTSSLLNNRLSLQFNLWKVHAFTANAIFFQKIEAMQGANSFSELRGNLQYRYSF